MKFGGFVSVCAADSRSSACYDDMKSADQSPLQASRRNKEPGHHTFGDDWENARQEVRGTRIHWKTRAPLRVTPRASLVKCAICVTISCGMTE